MSQSSSPKKLSLDPQTPLRRLPLATNSQLFHKADILLTTIGYHRGKLIPKLSRTPGRRRVDIRAPGPSYVPPLDLKDFDPEVDSELKIPLRPIKPRERHKSAFKEVVSSPRKSLISPQSRPFSTQKPTIESQNTPVMYSVTLSPEDKTTLKLACDRQKQKLEGELRVKLKRRLEKRNKLGIFSKQVNKIREESMFELVMQEK